MTFYRICCIIMVASYFSVAIQVPGMRMKSIAIMLTIVNYLLFWR